MKRTIATLCTALLAAPVAIAAAPVAGATATQEGTPPETVTAAAINSSTSRLVSLPPQRALDTRTGGAAPLAGGSSVDLPLAGSFGVPQNATSVVLNVTIVDAAGAGYVQAYPKGEPLQGLSSNLNVERAGQTIPNLAIVPLGAGGSVTLYNQAGGHLVADVLGAFVPADTATEGRYQAVNPARLLDTRIGTGAAAAKVGAGASIDLQVTGQGGVPATGVTAVALNVTAVEADANGYVQVVPTGGATALGTSSNLNVASGQVIANLVIVPVNNGKVTLYSSGGTHLLADVAGWFTDASGDDSTVGLFTPVAPARLLDTRLAGVKPGPESNTAVHPGGEAGVPSAGVAAVALNVTVVDATAPGYVQAYPASTPGLQGTSSTLNVERAGQTIPNAALATLGAAGTVALYTQSGTHLLADVSGWFSASFSENPGGNPGDGDGDGPGEEPPPPPDPTGPLAAYSLAQPIPGLSPRLIFSTQMRTPTAPQVVTISNIGQQPLTLGLAMVGSQATSFQLGAGTPATLTVAPGASADIPVVFAPPAGAAFKNHSAQLEATTNDPAHERIAIVLKGLNAFGFEGPNEPTLDEITDAIGLPAIDTGSPTLEFPTTGAELYGDEAAATLDAAGNAAPASSRVALFRRADSTKPVVALPVASYTAHHPEGPGTLALKSTEDTVRPLLSFPADKPGGNYSENQQLMPLAEGTTTFQPSSGPAWPGNLFGFEVNGNVVNSQREYTAGCTTFRVYPAQISDTNVLPNTYIVAADLICENGDYNDYVFLVSNVLPRARTGS